MDIDYAEIRAGLDRGERPDGLLWSSVHSAVRSGDLEAIFTLAYHHLRVHGPCYPLTRDWFLTAVEKGHPLAARYLAKVDVASKERREHLRLRAEAGELGAQVDLAETLYRNVDLLGGDFEAARHWYELAARQGSQHSQVHFGFMLLSGEGGPVDHTQAASWLVAAGE